MATAQLERLVEKQNKLWDRMQELQNRSETDEGWTAEDRTNWDAAEAELRTVSEDIERFQRAAKLEAADYFDRHPEGVSDNAERTSEEIETQRTEKYTEAFGTYMRYGMDRLDTEQRSILLEKQAPIETRAQGVGTNSAGGFLVPPGYRQVLSETMKAYGGLLNYANVITTSTGNPLQWPANDDTSNSGAILAENTQISQQDLTISSRTLGAYTYTSKLVLVSLQLLQDSAFPLDTWLPKKLGQRLGRAVAAHLTTGTGTGQPTGITTSVTVGKTGATGETLTLIYDDLIDLEHSVDPAYRTNNSNTMVPYGGANTDNGPGAMYVMHDQTLKVIRKLKDSQGRPLWVPVPAPGFPPTINGWPYVIDNSMPVPGANNISIIFGDIDAGFIVRQVLDLQMVRLQERYMDQLSVGFFGYSRLDARPDDPNAVKGFQHSAT